MGQGRAGLDIDLTMGASYYDIPPGNPFIGRAGHLEEIFALGLNLARGRENFGWNEIEGAACWPLGTACDDAGMMPPPLSVRARRRGLHHGRPRVPGLGAAGVGRPLAP